MIIFYLIILYSFVRFNMSPLRGEKSYDVLLTINSKYNVHLNVASDKPP